MDIKSPYLTQKFVELAEKFPDEVIMQVKTADGYVKYTYHDLYKQAKSIAKGLQQKHKIKKDDRVAIIMENGPDWVATYFGIMLAEAIAVPIDPKASKKVLRGGWYLTGDIGYCDDEGFFYMTARKRDLIKTGIYKVSAKEIEDVLFLFDGVLDAAEKSF